MAYGARLESVLGASPRGFESPILRHRTPGLLQVPGFLLFGTPLVFRAEGPAAVCAGGRGLKDKSCCWKGDFSALSRGKVTLLVGCVCLVPVIIGQNVLVLWRVFGLLVREKPH